MAYVSLIAVVGGGAIQGAVSQLGGIITQAAISGYSRDKEEEADRVGLTLLARAGYDAREGAEVFQHMLEATDKGGRRWSFLYATHPKMKSRVKSCRKLVEQLPPQLLEKASDVGQETYLAVASELIYAEAKTHIARGKLDLALETLTFMREAQPDQAEAPALLGDLYRVRRLSGDVDLAMAAYRDALETHPENSIAHRGLGLLFLKQDDPEQACHHLTRYLALSPDAADAVFIRQSLQQLDGKE